MCECVCLPCGKTTLIMCNRYPVILDEWKDVTWSLTQNVLSVLVKKKTGEHEDLLGFNHERTLFMY